MVRNEQLAALRRLRREAPIDDEEYENLAGSYRDSDLSPDQAATSDEADHDFGEEATVKRAPRQDVAQPVVSPTKTALRVNSPSYVISLAAASAVMILISALGMLSWWVSVPTILVLVTTLFEGWGKVTLVGGLAVVTIMVVGLLSTLGDSSKPAPVATGTIPPQDPYPPIPGSLGIYMDQVSTLWNTVDGPPRITRGLTRHNEIGEFDTFIYRFGDWGSLAGAFDPDTEAVYALLATGSFTQPATAQLYVHVCFLVAPYSQECIDAYHEQGLAEGTLEDFVDIAHEAEWALGDETWRLQIGQNLMAIRVYGKDAT
jgi:hypothetical protein